MNTEPLITVFRTPSFNIVNLTITIPVYSSQYKAVFSIGKDLPTEEANLPNIRAQGTGQSAVAIIDANADISVAGYIGGSCSTFLAMPIDTLGKAYYILTFEPKLVDERAIVSIAAGNLATEVLIVLPVGMGNINFEGKTYSAGDSINKLVPPYTAMVIEETIDLSGLYIETDRPVAVFSGNNDIRIGPGTVDSVASQLPSIDRWGHQFIVIPPMTSEGYIKVISSERNSRVIFYGTGVVGGTHTYVLDTPGSSYLYRINSHVYMFADKPILVMFYTNSDNGILPSALLVTPIEQYHNYYLFNSFLAKTQTFTRFDVTLIIIVQSEYKDGVILNGFVQVATGWEVIPESGGYVMKLVADAPSGDFEVWHVDSNVHFGVFIYGSNEGDCTFSMPAGARAAILNPVSI